jgi:hypothetical protein
VIQAFIPATRTAGLPSPPSFKEKVMVMILIGAAIGASLTLAVVLGGFKVHSKEAWEEHELTMRTSQTRVFTLTAENAKLRVSLAAGEMTEDGKKVAAMTMAALDTVIAAEKIA